MEADEREKSEAVTKKLLYFLKEDLNAVKFCLNITYIAHLWDDLVDRDKTRNETDIDNGFIVMLLDIPGNPFYQQHQIALRTIMHNAILQWQDANVMERASLGDHDLHMAYMLRASIVQIFSYCAYLIGGPGWIKEIGPDIRRMYEEPLENYMEEMKKCQPQLLQE